MYPMVLRTEIRQSRVGLIFALCSLAAGPAAQGHSISTIEGEAGVHRDRVELKVKVRPEDILLSAGMSLSDYNVYFLLTASTRSPHVPREVPPHASSVPGKVSPTDDLGFAGLCQRCLRP